MRQHVELSNASIDYIKHKAVEYGQMLIIHERNQQNKRNT